jgi:hypothetical protein
MALELTIDCSYHQKDDDARQETISLNTIDEHTAMRIKQQLERNGWIVQFNGEHMDTYCSKRCAR